MNGPLKKEFPQMEKWQSPTTSGADRQIISEKLGLRSTELPTVKPVQRLKITLHFPEYSHGHFGNKKYIPVRLKIHQGKLPDVAALRWKDCRARQSCGRVSSYLGAKRSILVHKNEGMRVPTAARGYEWRVICELAC